MLHRFPTFEVDEDTREVRSAQRTLQLQPRVFDVLVYLIRHRTRVVPKDELLENVWPGMVVTDASLQRAVSLVRSNLDKLGAPDAIRTLARQGYRFCVEPPAAEHALAKPARPALDRGHAAYAKGEWMEAIAALREVDDFEGLTGDDLQRWAHAAQCAGRPQEAVPPLERAVAAYTARGDRRKAAWAAILLAQLRVEWREQLLAKGLFHRAARLLAGEPECRERGYLDLLGARVALLSNEIEQALEFGERARSAGARFGDPDLESLGLVHVGEASLYLGRIREGLAAIDEAGGSVAACGLSPWAGGLVYCGVIYSCMTRADWHRAGEWTQQFTSWCEGRGVAGYPGLCRMHRAEVLAVRGELVEAEREIRATQEMLARQAPWAEGDAWRVLGDVLLARGELAGAHEAYGRAADLGWESQFGLALVKFAEGNAAASARLIARLLAENAWSCRVKRGQALAHYVIIAAAAGELEPARAALAELDREPDLTSTPALAAWVARAQAELAAAEGRPAEGISHLRAALRTWQSMNASIEAATIRCRLSSLLEREGDLDAAALELAAAAKVFQRAGADSLLRNCERLRCALQGQKPKPRPLRARAKR
jgi:DNA-binding winged helix-turn-helix (wHTH) protein